MKTSEPQTLEQPTSSVRFRLECVFAFSWNRCSLSIGMSVRFQLERAAPLRHPFSVVLARWAI